MQRKRKAYEILINAAIFIVLEIAALSMLNNNGELQRAWFSKISHSFMTAVWGGSERVVDYFALKKENESLSQEVYKLTKQLTYYKELVLIDEADSFIAETQYEGEFAMIPASISKLSTNKQHNYFIINKGYEDGVRPNSGIITPQGAVGIIDAVDRHYSFGLSFMNTGVSISARLGSEGVVGLMFWDGIHSNKAIVKELPLHIEFTPGDTVWTSGYSAIFPPDIPLGVSTGSRIVNGSTKEVNVELFEDLTSLKYVIVTENAGRDQILNLEQIENKLGQ